MKISSEVIFVFSRWWNRAGQIASEKMYFTYKKDLPRSFPKIRVLGRFPLISEDNEILHIFP